MEELGSSEKTSLQRTYRNLRLAIAGTVIFIGIAVAIAATTGGLLPSISAYYYTSARNIFVGALIGSAVAILAISGYGIQRVLLDAAGLCAPLIALVPVPMTNGTVPGYPNPCPGDTLCVPASVVPDVSTSVITYLIAGGIGILVAFVLTLVRPKGDRVNLRAVIPSFTVAVAILGLVALGWFGARDIFLPLAHIVASVSFFTLIAAVAAVNVFEPPTQGDAPPARWKKIAYWIIASAMVVDLAMTLLASLFGFGADMVPPPVFIGEFISLLLFLAFWVLQTLQSWDHSADARGRFG